MKRCLVGRRNWNRIKKKKKPNKKEADKINGEETMVSQKLWAKLFILEERAVVRPKEEQKVKI